MTFLELPAPTLIPQTLTVVYHDGSEIKVPYFDRDSAIAFLSLEDGVANFFVDSYKGE